MLILDEALTKPRKYVQVASLSCSHGIKSESMYELASLCCSRGIRVWLEVERL